MKLYSLNENNAWVEMGTGYVTVQHVERLQCLSLTVRSESDGTIVCLMCVCVNTMGATHCLGTVLLESRILTDRSYQKREVRIVYYNYHNILIYAPHVVHVCIKFETMINFDKI